MHIDDDDLFLASVKKMLEKDGTIEVQNQFTSGIAFMQALPQLAPFHLLLMDMKMPQMNGLELVKKVKKYNHKLPIICFSGHTFPEYIQLVKLEGVDFCLQKNQIKALPTFIKKYADKQSVTIKTKETGELNSAELELILLICNHYTREEIADKFNIGPDAVKVRKTLLAAKLGIENEKSHFLLWAIRQGYLVV